MSREAESTPGSRWETSGCGFRSEGSVGSLDVTVRGFFKLGFVGQIPHPVGATCGRPQIQKMLANINFYIIGRPQVAPTVWWKLTDKPKSESQPNRHLQFFVESASHMRNAQSEHGRRSERDGTPDPKSPCPRNGSMAICLQCAQKKASMTALVAVQDPWSISEEPPPLADRAALISLTIFFRSREASPRPMT